MGRLNKSLKAGLGAKLVGSASFNTKLTEAYNSTQGQRHTAKSAAPKLSVYLHHATTVASPTREAKRLPLPLVRSSRSLFPLKEKNSFQEAGPCHYYA